jgi:hypothetical protein
MLLQLLREVLFFWVGCVALFVTGARAAIWYRRVSVRRRTRERLFALVRL